MKAQLTIVALLATLVLSVGSQFALRTRDDFGSSQTDRAVLSRETRTSRCWPGVDEAATTAANQGGEYKRFRRGRQRKGSSFENQEFNHAWHHHPL